MTRLSFFEHGHDLRSAFLIFFLIFDVRVHVSLMANHQSTCMSEKKTVHSSLLCKQS